MNQKGKSRPKEQTIHQLNARSNRNYMSGRIVSMLQTTNCNFSPQELVNIESALREDMQSHPWLLNLCKAITDESVVVTKEELEIYNKHKNEGQEILVGQPKIDDMNNELEFLKERTNQLKYVLGKLTTELENSGKRVLNDNQANSDIWLQMRIKLKESLELLRNDLTKDLSVDEPQTVVDCITTKMNDILSAIDTNESSKDLLDKLLDDLTLTEDNKLKVLEAINAQFYFKLETIYKCLNDLLNECLQIKEYYDMNVSEEISWRTDVTSLVNQLQDLDNESPVVSLAETETNDFVAKRSLITQYSKIFAKVEKHEFDEIQTLIDQLAQRIQILSPSRVE